METLRNRRGRPSTTKQFIEPETLRSLVAKAQANQFCCNELAEFLMRIHDIVHVKHECLRKLDTETWEECRGYSLERWLKSGIYRIDLEKYKNPFFYFTRGSYLNMLHRLIDIRKDQECYKAYCKSMKKQLEQICPSLQNKDLEAVNDL